MSPTDSAVALDPGEIRYDRGPTGELRRIVLTPEGLPLALGVASIFERAAALFLDLAILFFSFLIISVGTFIALDRTLAFTVVILTFFVLRNGYFAFFEIHWSGRTPGKRIVRLRVVDADGGPLGHRAVLARNLLRELEFFVPPAESAQWYEYWCNARLNWYVEHGIPESMLRLRAHDDDELSHYSAGTADVEFMFPWGFDELEGIAQRTDYDLKQHAEHSGERLDYFDQQANERYVPYVIEPAAGATRTMAAFLLAAYDEDVVNDETRTVLRLHPRLAPYKVAVLPLSRKDTLTPLAHEVRKLLSERYMVDYDETQAIGRRYRRQDEIGTPLAVTVDFDSLDDKAVTVRDRDTTEQVRVPIDELLTTVGDRLGF